MKGVALGRRSDALLYIPEWDVSIVKASSSDAMVVRNTPPTSLGNYTVTDLRRWFGLVSVFVGDIIVGYAAGYSGDGVRVALVDVDGFSPKAEYAYHIASTVNDVSSTHDYRSVATLKDNSPPYIGLAPKCGVRVYPVSTGGMAPVADFVYALGMILKDMRSGVYRPHIICIPMEAHGSTRDEIEVYVRAFTWFREQGIPVIVAYANMGISDFAKVPATYPVASTDWSSQTCPRDKLYAPTNFATSEGVYTGTSASTVAMAGATAIIIERGADPFTYLSSGGCNPLPV
ncbi:MAG: hypothetical protein QW453_03190 [Thermoprotei archaeon]